MSNAGEGGVKPVGENKPLGAPRGKRPRIRVSCVDQTGARLGNVGKRMAHVAGAEVSVAGLDVGEV